MADDVIAKCIASNSIINGGILVKAPMAADQISSAYLIDTYSYTGLGTGFIYDHYDPRFTGIAPCSTFVATSFLASMDCLFSNSSLVSGFNQSE